jgi:hypothetical protein
MERQGASITFDLTARSQMQQAIDAVCEELGIRPNERLRRAAITRNVIAAYRHGHRLPLNLVDAGLSTTGA